MDMLGNDDDDDLVPVKDDFVNAGMSTMGVDPEHVFNQQVSSILTKFMSITRFMSRKCSVEGGRRKVVERRARGPLPPPPRGERRAQEACVQTGGQDQEAGTAHFVHRFRELNYNFKSDIVVSS